MHKPWKIYATYSTLQSRQLDSFSHRADAEQAAIRYRQMLSKVALVRVIWSNEHEQ
jgi:Txe/YoeB family toxin of Txe-Axe toxin-antitoxin module